jgi:hypothetical protein
LATGFEGTAFFIGLGAGLAAFGAGLGAIVFLGAGFFASGFTAFLAGLTAATGVFFLVGINFYPFFDTNTFS